MIEGLGWWFRYLVVMTLLIVIARAFWCAARDEREARQWEAIERFNKWRDALK